MPENQISATYPHLCQLLHGSRLDDDLAVASELLESPNASNEFRQALEGRLFAQTELMWLLCGAIVPELDDPAGRELERNLAAVVEAIGDAVARVAYRDKLLVDKSDKLEDTRYELAVTAKACACLDPGSVLLEKPISDVRKNSKDWKNTDVYGTFHGQPLRIEVTVIHESLPDAVDLELDELVRAADVSLGFSITLRVVLADKGYAERVRALLELLHDAHVTSGGRNEEIDCVRFEWRGGAYHCDHESSPFTSICFYTADEFAGAEQIRNIIHPCSVRKVTPDYVLEDHPNPPGVVTSAGLSGSPTKVPVSTKIHQMLAGKLQQCEQGLVNIIAFGNPLRMHDREVASAVLGPEVVLVHMGKCLLQREPKAPFVPVQYLPNPDDQLQFVDPFRRMSAVWHVRLGRDATSEWLGNPNAAFPVPTECATALSGCEPRQVSRSVVTDESCAVPQPIHSPDHGEDDQVVITEFARDCVNACGTVEDAQRILRELADTGLTMEQIQETVDVLDKEDGERVQKTRFVSPSNNEVAMQFVLDCCGYELAAACLEAFNSERHADLEDGHP